MNWTESFVVLYKWISEIWIWWYDDMMIWVIIRMFIISISIFNNLNIMITYLQIVYTRWPDDSDIWVSAFHHCVSMGSYVRISWPPCILLSLIMKVIWLIILYQKTLEQSNFINMILFKLLWTCLAILTLKQTDIKDFIVFIKLHLKMYLEFKKE